MGDELTRRLCGVFACSVGLVVSSSLTSTVAQDEARHVYVTVLDTEGAPIAGLSTQHFAVRESGRDRTVLAIEPLRVPMHVAVLVDTSLANGLQSDTLRTAIARFVDRLAAFNDVALYSCGDRALQLVPFTRDIAQLRAAALKLFGWSHQRSNLIDGIDRTLSDLQKIETARPIVLAITSESPEASSRTAASVVRRLISQSTALHAISLATATGTGKVSGVANDFESSSRELRNMAAAGEGDRERTQALQLGTVSTGGGWQRVTSPMAVEPALERLARELSSGYRVTFARPGRDRTKELQVGVLLEGVTLRATAAPYGTR